jgi:hypothetical protein
LRRLSLLPLLLLLGACDSATDPYAGPLRLRTSASEFVIAQPEGSVSVPFTVTNQGNAGVRLLRCGGQVTAAVDRQEAGRWEQYSGGYCLLALQEGPRELGPGEALQSMVAIRDPGLYRLHVGVTTSDGYDWAPASNLFVVR